MTVIIYDLKAEPGLRVFNVEKAVSKIERIIDADDKNMEWLILHANGNKTEYSMKGIAYVLFEDNADYQSWSLKKLV
jgi:hypothetical protein